MRCLLTLHTYLRLSINPTNYKKDVRSRYLLKQHNNKKVFIYNKLVDCFRKHELFYIIGAFYFALFSSVAVLLAHPIIGMQNEARNPNRIIGKP